MNNIASCAGNNGNELAAATSYVGDKPLMRNCTSFILHFNASNKLSAIMRKHTSYPLAIMPKCTSYPLAIVRKRTSYLIAIVRKCTS